MTGGETLLIEDVLMGKSHVIVRLRGNMQLTLGVIRGLRDRGFCKRNEPGGCLYTGS